MSSEALRSMRWSIVFSNPIRALPTLAADLRAMLDEHQALHASRFLEQPVLEPQVPSLAGQIVGAYRLLSLMGHGGSGSVWLAERADGRFKGRAAVKLLNISLIGRDGEERFRREGTILARLRHPHIAQLIDAGNDRVVVW